MLYSIHCPTLPGLMNIFCDLYLVSQDPGERSLRSWKVDRWSSLWLGLEAGGDVKTCAFNFTKCDCSIGNDRKTIGNHRKTIGKWWFNGKIMGFLASGND